MPSLQYIVYSKILGGLLEFKLYISFFKEILEQGSQVFLLGERDISKISLKYIWQKTIPIIVKTFLNTKGFVYKDISIVGRA